MKFIAFLVISLTSATLWGRVPTTTQQFSVRFGQEVNTLLGAKRSLSYQIKAIGKDNATSKDIAKLLGVNVDDVSKVIKLQSLDIKISKLKQEIRREKMTDEEIVAKYRGLLVIADNDYLFDKQTSERLNTFLYALDTTYPRQTEAKLYAAYLEKDYDFAFALDLDSPSAKRVLVHTLFKTGDQEYVPDWKAVEFPDEDKVAALHNIKFINETVAKLWAKGDDLSGLEKEALVELLKSPDGDTALAALQSPVTTKLAKLNGMLASYHLDGIPEKLLPEKTAEMNKMVEEINTEVGRYKTIRTMTSTYGKSIPQIEVTATQVLQMSKVKDLTRLHNQLHIVGTPDDVVNAYLHNLDFMNLKYFILRSNFYKDSYTPALKKILAEGDLESEVFPIYNALVRNDAGQDLTQLIAQRIVEPTHTAVSLISSMDYAPSSDLDKLLLGVHASAELFKKAELSEERSNEIRLAHQRLKGAGEDGNQPITSLSVWANDMIAMADRKLANADDVSSSLESVPALLEGKKIWEEKMKEITEIEIE